MTTEVQGRRRAQIWLLLKVTLALIVLGGLFFTGSIDLALLNAPLQSPGLLVGTALLLFAGVLLGGMRWWLILHAVGIHVNFRNLLEIHLIGVFFSTWMPGAAGGDAARGVYIFRALPARRTSALLTIVIDRVFALFGLVFTAAAIAFYLFDPTTGLDHMVVYQRVLLVVLGVGAAVGILTAAGAFLIKTPATWRFFGRIRPFAHQVRNAVQLMASRWPIMLVCAVISVAASSLVAVGVVLLFSTFGFSAPSLLVALAGVIGNISSAIPLTPGGIGIGEAAFSQVLHELGATPAPYATIYLAFRVVMVLVSLFGVYFWLMRRGVASTPQASNNVE